MITKKEIKFKKTIKLTANLINNFVKKTNARANFLYRNRKKTTYCGINDNKIVAVWLN